MGFNYSENWDYAECDEQEFQDYVRRLNQFNTIDEESLNDLNETVERKMQSLEQ